MERGNGLKVLSILFAFSFIHVLRTTAAGDTMSPNQTMSGNQTLISAGGAFELGFFSPESSSDKYLGIWYKSIPVQTIVWVANRDTPLSPSSTGTLTLTAAGNLLLLDNSTGDIIWSTTTSTSSNPTLQLFDTGNLVLGGGSPKTSLWQSFDHPTDTMIPEMKLGFDMQRKLEWHLTSWKSSSDPSPGAYTYKLDRQGYPELYLWSGASRKYGTGPWNGHGFSGIPFMRNNRVFSFNFVANQNESYAAFHINQKSVLCRLVLDQSGVLQRWVWLDVSQRWNVYWSIPQDQCDAYTECGPFGVCNAGGSLICNCMRGFVPKSPEKWALRDSSDGCVRRVNLSCATDGFVKVAGLKLPGTLNAIMGSNMSWDGCKDKCARNCSCTAFFSSLDEGGGCINWFGGLVDIREFEEQGQDLYVRLAASDLVDPQQGKKSHLRIILVAAASCLLLIMILILCFIWRIKDKYRAKKKLLEAPTILMEYSSITRNMKDKERNSEFSLFKFSHIVDATSNFANENKLGEGGFGPVYKGKLPEGQEIAVKRLAACSRQGFEEFQNEIILIAKLQHRNLVKLLGCCTQGEEQLLIYEYMPNKSLDVFLFDLDKRSQLDWDRRVEIIEGIAQGLLYLHKHSRLRIIHRDLKASNILLDADMTPKISDFGMARIFGSEDHAHSSTKRIVGTYGYMSPEYAIKGQFSVKSDVFSFGVLMLEIISGQKNSSFQQYGQSLSLLGYAWESWRNDDCLEFVDLSLRDRCPTHEISKCIKVALLCVQDSASDRPTMSNVITMLHSESANLPSPKEPSFFSLGVVSEGNQTSSKSTSSSNNQTITVVFGR